MKRAFKAAVIAFTTQLVGCAGLSVTPLTPNQASLAHSDSSSINGYIAYHPAMIVAIGTKNGSCGIDSIQYLPDYSKPYLVRIDKGIGSSTTKFDLTNGWMLSSASATVDNSVISEKLFNKLSATTLTLSSESKAPDASLECVPGIYRYEYENGKQEFKRIKLTDFK